MGKGKGDVYGNQRRLRAKRMKAFVDEGILFTPYPQGSAGRGIRPMQKLADELNLPILVTEFKSRMFWIRKTLA